MAKLERVGIIGWNYPEWRAAGAYPRGAKKEDFLALYARTWPTVEVASSFYRAPPPQTIAEWDAQTPPGFVLSLKVPDWIVKKPADEDAREGLRSFVAKLAPLAGAKKLGALVAQFAPTFRRDKREADLRAFVAALPKGPRWAIELRHASWWHEDTYKLLSDARVTLVWSALESGRTPPVVTSDALYLRLFLDRELQPPYGTKRRDNAPEMEYWAARLRDEGASASAADVMLSKFLEGYAPGSAATMRRLLGQPEPTWPDPIEDRPAEGPKQSKLF